MQRLTAPPEEAEEGHRQMIEKWKEMEIDEY